MNSFKGQSTFLSAAGSIEAVADSSNLKKGLIFKNTNCGGILS